MRPSHFIAVGITLALSMAPGMIRAAVDGGTIPVDQLGLIPLPRLVTAYENKWRLPATVHIAAPSPSESNVAGFLKRFLTRRGIHAQIVASGPVQIRLSTAAKDTQLGREGYRLRVGSNGASLSANAGQGLFYALQTFEQLFNPAKPTDNAIHEVSITDWPRYRWRGIMLDCSRHFFPVPVVEKFLRVAAHYKLNVFHWHLSDDEGWRIQIQQYPLLTQIGAWRTGSGALACPPAAPHAPRYGGYYSDAEIRQIVAFARRRGITVIPEIDIPGHCGAAMAAYPWLADSKTIPPWGTPLCPSTRTFKFLDTVFGELVSLFPGKFVHIGGDEVYLKAWSNNPIVQKLMRRKHWKSLEQVHDYFAQKMARFLITKNRRAVIWNAAAIQTLPHGTVVECWTWNSAGIASQYARLGYDVVVAQQTRLYFDWYQGDRKYEPRPTQWETTLRDTYGFNPSSEVPSSLRKRLLGIEGCLWTEMISSNHHLFYMLLPRELALAEIGWTPLKEQNYGGFVDRTKWQYLWLRANGYNFRIPQPSFQFTGNGGKVTVRRDNSHNALEIQTTSPIGLVRMRDPVPGTVIYYTLNGSIPNIRSALYHMKISVKLSPGNPVVVRGIAVDPSGRSSAPSRLVLQLDR